MPKQAYICFTTGIEVFRLGQESCRRRAGNVLPVFKTGASGGGANESTLKDLKRL